MSLNFLLAAWGNPGNLNPLLTAARQLRRRGHRVRILGEITHHDDIARAGFHAIPWRRPVPIQLAAPDSEEPTWAEFRVMLDRVMFGPALDYALDTADALCSEPTDAVLSHDLLAGPALAAEAMGIPCALLAPHISARPLEGVPFCLDGVPLDDTPELARARQVTLQRFVELQNSFLPVLNRARAAFGLAPLCHIHDHYDRIDRVLIGLSAAFDFPAVRLPDNLRYVGPLLDPPAWARPWTAPWSGTSARPRVLVSLSTSFQNQANLLRRIIRALGTLDLDAVVTAGPAMDQEEFAAPGNVTVVHSAPHDAVMKEVSLVVTHGGHGTVARALLNRVPLLVIPMGRDQMDNAARVAARGAGLALSDGANEADIVGAVQRLVGERHFRDAAARLGSAMKADMASPILAYEMEAIGGDARPGWSEMLRSQAAG